MILRLAANEDLSALISWIEDKAACRLWAGPLVRFPLALEGLKQDIKFSDRNTFAMIDDGGELFGLGQLLEKEENRIHMARIIVSPVQRGRGYGDLLCRLLISEGLKRFGKVYFTLNVYSNNTTAIKLYQKLGFQPKSPPLESIPAEDIVHMVFKPGPNAKLT